MVMVLTRWEPAFFLSQIPTFCIIWTYVPINTLSIIAAIFGMNKTSVKFININIREQEKFIHQTFTIFSHFFAGH